MLAAADLGRTGGPFWGGFWDFLWNRSPSASTVPLRASISEDRLRAYLIQEVASRYDEPSTPAQPVPGTTTFTPGDPLREATRLGPLSSQAQLERVRGYIKKGISEGAELVAGNKS